MNILIACEESQEICKAMRERGHRAFSADLQECSGGHPEWHINGDVLPIINGDCEFTTSDGKTHTIVGQWDMLIAHPPCTYLSNCGNRWLYPTGKNGKLNEERLSLGMKAKAFLCASSMPSATGSWSRILPPTASTSCPSTPRLFSPMSLVSRGASVLAFGLRVCRC